MSRRRYPSDWPAIRFAVFKRDGFRCQYCMCVPDAGSWLEPDHIVPRSWGGSDDIENLLTTCRECNHSKGTKCIVPDRMLSEPGVDGFRTWKQWGGWHLQLSTEGGACVLVFVPNEYWIPIHRVHEQDWEPHLRRKHWLKAERFSHPLRPNVPAQLESGNGWLKLDELEDDIHRDQVLFRQQEPSVPDSQAWEFRNVPNQAFYDFVEAIGFSRRLITRASEADG